MKQVLVKVCYGQCFFRYLQVLHLFMSKVSEHELRTIMNSLANHCMQLHNQIESYLKLNRIPFILEE